MSIVLDVSGASIMDACFINESGYTTNALDQWAELCHSLGYDITPLSRAVGGSTVRSANGALTQIAAVDARYTGATVEVLAVIHCWGNQNSENGAYPADWDATEIANFREDVVNVVTALNATPIDDAIYCNMTYRVGVGTGVNTDIIEDEFSNEGETTFVDLYASTLAAANAGIYFVSGDPIHPTSTGVPAIHTPILDYIAANHSALSILKTYEDKAVINFGGDAVRYIGNLNQIDATGSHSLIGQSGAAMGTLVLTGGSGFAGTGFTSSSPINKNALYWNAEHWAIDDGTFYGINAGYTVQYSDATRPNREVIITIFCSRDASGREFDLTFDGITTRVDPQGITGPRTVSRQVTLDGSGNAPLITGSLVGTYLYLTGMDVQLVPASSEIEFIQESSVFSLNSPAQTIDLLPVEFSQSEAIFGFSSPAQTIEVVDGPVEFSQESSIFGFSAPSQSIIEISLPVEFSQLPADFTIGAPSQSISFGGTVFITAYTVQWQS